MTLNFNTALEIVKLHVLFAKFNQDTVSVAVRELSWS